MSARVSVSEAVGAHVLLGALILSLKIWAVIIIWGMSL